MNAVAERYELGEILRRFSRETCDVLSLKWMAIVGVLLLLAGCSRPAEKEPKSGVEYQPASHFLARGDPVEGRNSFINLECHTCHAVSGEDFKTTTPNQTAPRLGSMESHKSPDYLAAAIVMPSHAISARPGKWQTITKSGMIEYADVITVRQLVDIVAYIRSLPANVLNH